MSRVTVKQLKEEIDALRAEVEKLKRKSKYDWYENGIPQRRKCPYCGKSGQPYQPYPYYNEKYYCEEFE